MTIALETRGLNKTFGAVSAAVDINISIEEKEVVGIIGANGAGKTTFINMITGYLKPSSGSIFYQDREITRLIPRELTQIGLRRSFQIPQIFPELSVLDNVMIAKGAISSEKRRFWNPLKSSDTVAEALHLLERYDIVQFRDQNVSNLSQGVRKLLDIAMAIVGDTSVLMLDEPTSGVSVEEKFDIMDILMSSLKDDNITVLFVEHDIEIVERYSERVIAFVEGMIVADGNPDEVLSDETVRRCIIGDDRQIQKTGQEEN